MGNRQCIKSVHFHTANQAYLWNSLCLQTGNHCKPPFPKNESLQVFSTCVLVRFCRTLHQGEAQYVLWFKISLDMNTFTECISESWKIRKLFRRATNEPSTGSRRLPGDSQLDKGELHYLYIFLLYCDDFKARSILFPRGAIGVCYMIPLGLLHCKQKSFPSVRRLCLTLSVVSTNQVLEFSILDIITETTKRF